MTQQTPLLRPFNGRAIPQVLKDQPRWAPWIAVFNDKRGKFDKIPRRADTPEYGLSTADPSRWFTYTAAVSTYEREKPSLAGVGYVMTKPHGVVGTDLDDCVADGVVAPWALDVVRLLDSYTEVSPSGKGLRVFNSGAADDWTNHTVGIEVYGGSAPRFLTLTGEHLAGTPLTVNAMPTGVMDGLRGLYASAVRPVQVEALGMPDLLDDLVDDVPDWRVLDLPYAARDFLDSGEHGGDRSRQLHSTAVALYQAGLVDNEVLSVLAANPHTMEVALDHRGQDVDRALAYLWKEHGPKAKAKGVSNVVSADDFEVAGLKAGPAADSVADTAIKSVAKPMRFRVLPTAEFLVRPRASWIVKGLLPKAGLAVVFGESGSGKTFWVLDLVGAVARGVEWRGHAVKQGKVVYVCAEGVAGFRNRLDAYCQHNGLSDLDIGVIPDAPNLLEKGDVRDLMGAIKAFGPTDIVVVDTFAQAMPGANENSGEDVGLALAHCRSIHKATGALVILVHHSGKDSRKGARGWSGLRAAADAEIEILRSDNARSATVTKLKDGEDGAEFGFTLTTTAIGEDDGEAVSSCVVAHSAAAARKQAMPKGDKQKLVMRVAQDMLDLAESVTTSELIDNVVNQISFDKADGKGDNRRRDALRAITSLAESGRLTTEGGKVNLS